MRSCMGVSAEVGRGVVDFFMFPKESSCHGTASYRKLVPLGTCQLCTEAIMSVQSSRPTGVTKTDYTRTPKEAWLIVALLFLFMLINFADKAVIGIAAVPTAIVAQGAGVGIMVALPLLNWVIVHYSWHWAFGVLGLAGLAWTAAWLALGREGPLTAASAADVAPIPGRIAYGQLLLSPTIIAAWCASFGAQWGLSQALSWQGAFLIKGLGFTQGSIGLLGALPAGASVVLVIAAGWCSQRLRAHGASSRMARGIFGGACVALGGATLAIMPSVAGIPGKIALTTI